MKRTLVTALLLAWSFTAHAAQPMKEWTFLLFLNGHNNLDSYGDMNLKQMEKVGSTDQVNLVVQWASARASTTKRLYIQKSTNPNAVTSPVVDNPGQVDMGDYRELVKFVEWGAKNYPAKRYFVAIWNHGGGWHNITRMKQGFDIHPNDISWDDNTGNFITTTQLGQAMTEISRILGQKVDLYGSDACLMAMAEVAAEMKDSVSAFIGSEETEPGEGWPYDTFLARLVANPGVDGVGLGKILSTEYLKAYSGGEYGHNDVTMSVMDLTKFGAFEQSMKNFAQEMKGFDLSKKQVIMNSANSSQSYAYYDYKDLVDFLGNLESAKVLKDVSSLRALREAATSLVVQNDVSDAYKNSHGISFWLPTSRYTYDDYKSRYEELSFERSVNWGDFLSRLNQ